MAGNLPSLVVSVVGLSHNPKKLYSGNPGIGKSCLCFRFVHSGFDDYVADHPSLLALHEFESTVINTDNFLYWGGTVKSYPVRGSTHELKIIYHVLEQTVFYQDVTSRPFKSAESPDQYARRVASTNVESAGKISYLTRDLICSPEEYESQHYPPSVGKLGLGYIVVVDVSLKGTNLAWSMSQTERLLSVLHSKKRKFVIAATKWDLANTDSIEHLREMKRKFKTEVVETSALNNYNIGDAFRVLAARVLKKTPGLSDHVPHYEDAAHAFLLTKGSANRSFRSFLNKRILVSTECLSAIKRNEEYRSCVETIGKKETDKQFFVHLLEVKNSEIDSYAGVKENVELRLEFLEEYIEDREEFRPFIKSLRSQIETIGGRYEDEVPSDLEEPPPVPPSISPKPQTTNTPQGCHHDENYITLTKEKPPTALTGSAPPSPLPPLPWEGEPTSPEDGDYEDVNVENYDDVVGIQTPGNQAIIVGAGPPSSMTGPTSGTTPPLNQRGVNPNISDKLSASSAEPRRLPPVRVLNYSAVEDFPRADFIVPVSVKTSPPLRQAQYIDVQHSSDTPPQEVMATPPEEHPTHPNGGGPDGKTTSGGILKRKVALEKLLRGESVSLVELAEVEDEQVVPSPLLARLGSKVGVDGQHAPCGRDVAAHLSSSSSSSASPTAQHDSPLLPKTVDSPKPTVKKKPPRKIKSVDKDQVFMNDSGGHSNGGISCVVADTAPTSVTAHVFGAGPPSEGGGKGCGGEMAGETEELYVPKLATIKQRIAIRRQQQAVFKEIVVLDEPHKTPPLEQRGTARPPSPQPPHRRPLPPTPTPADQTDSSPPSVPKPAEQTGFTPRPLPSVPKPTEQTSSAPQPLPSAPKVNPAPYPLIDSSTPQSVTKPSRLAPRPPRQCSEPNTVLCSTATTEQAESPSLPERTRESFILETDDTRRQRDISPSTAAKNKNKTLFDWVSKGIVKKQSSPKHVATRERSGPAASGTFLVMDKRPLPQMPFTMEKEEIEALEMEVDYERVDEFVQAQSLLMATHRGVWEESPAPRSSGSSSVRKSHSFDTRGLHSTSARSRHSGQGSVVQGFRPVPGRGRGGGRGGVVAPHVSGSSHHAPPTDSADYEVTETESRTALDLAHDYDYPHFGTLPGRGRSRAPVQLRPPLLQPLPTRGRRPPVPLPVEDEDESGAYVPMNSQFKDDDYYNWQAFRSTHSLRLAEFASDKPPSGLRPRLRYSLDDSAMYINLPTPEVALVQRTLPPRHRQNAESKPVPTPRRYCSSSSSGSIDSGPATPTHVPPLIATTERRFVSRSVDQLLTADEPQSARVPPRASAQERDSANFKSLLPPRNVPRSEA